MMGQYLPILTVHEVLAERAWVPAGIHAGAQQVPRALDLLLSWPKEQRESLPGQRLHKPKAIPWSTMPTSCLEALTDPSSQGSLEKLEVGDE